MSQKLFAFDIGTGSLGIAVREGNEIIDARSLIIPENIASVKEQRERRSQWRTRQAHKAREIWLKEQCKKAGIEVLEGRKPGNSKKGIKPQKGDTRLEIEFASCGEKTVYTSCLLRILLLRGEKLEGWQVYKALHSAIQRRGYDPEVAWKSRTNKNEDDEKDNKKSINEFEQDLQRITKGKEEFMYPCYYDAKKMGLWNPETDEIQFKQKHHAKRARGYTPTRKLVVKEAEALLEAAAKQFPGLAGKTNYILYGPAEEPYASHDPELRKKFGLKEGGETDRQGALSQKIPRFDNRMPDKCSLIPRYNVCRAADHLAMQLTFLMKLINIRYWDENLNEQQLTPEDIRTILEDKKSEAEKLKKELKSQDISKKTIMEEIAKKYQKSLKTWIKKKKNGHPLTNHEKIEKPKISGRARFSRPAMRLMKDLILSGKSPHEFYRLMAKELDNTDPAKGLVKEDLAFLLKLPDEWQSIHIPQFTLAERFGGGSADSDTAIKAIITKQRNPVIRHRMEVFYHYLDELTKQYGTPDRVVIELVRQDFLSGEAKRRFEKWQRDNRKRNKEARQKAEELGVTGYKDRTKLRLLKQQSYQCLYTGENLSGFDLSELEIDHAVPRGGGYNGSDSFYNKVVTRTRTNREKGDRTPYEFINKWDAFCDRVKKINSTKKGNSIKLTKKGALLTAEHPEELDDKYTSLAETAWIARIARNVVCLKYGWQYGEKGEKEKAIVVDGKLTANVRSRYRLNQLLADPNETDPEKIEKKNREDDRHHALDAMVLSYITQKKPELPEGVNRDYFRPIIEQVVPEQIAFEKPELEQTIYAKRFIREGRKIKECIVKRVLLKELGIESGKFSLKKAQKNIQKIMDRKIRSQLEDFLKNEPDQASWEAFVNNLRQSEKAGSRVMKVAINIGEPDEYRNLSKNDGRGQYRKADKHQGQFLYIDNKGKAKVRPVYAFESKSKVKAELKEKDYRIIDFFEASCLVEIQKELDLGNRIIPAGKFRLGSMWTNGQVKLEGPSPVLKNPIGIAMLLSKGFRRVR